MIETFGQALRRLREQAGLSQSELSRRVFVSQSTISRIESGKQAVDDAALAGRLDETLDAHGTLTARLTSVPVPEGVLTPDEAGRLAYVADQPRRVDHAALDSLAVVLAASRRLEDAIGAAPMIEPVHGHLTLMENLVLDARGPIRPSVVSVAAQYAQFAGWLHAATRQLPASDRWFSRTLEWAIEANNVTLQANAISFKGHLAWMVGHAGSTIGLSQAAQRNPEVHVSQRAFDAMQEARGHAMAGDTATADRKLGDAEELTALFAEQTGDTPPWSYYYTPALFVLQRGLVHRYLGRHQAAADLLTDGLDALPPEQRSAEWTGDYRRALEAAQQAL